MISRLQTSHANHKLSRPMKLICSLIAAGLQLFFPKEDIMLAASKKISKGLLFLFFFRPAMPVIFGFVYMVSMGVSSLQS